MSNGREVGVAHEGVFVFKFIAQGSVRPAALGIISLIVKSGAVEMVDGVEGAVEENKVRRIAASIGDDILVRSPVVIFEAGEAVLPARWTAHEQFGASENIVGACLLIRVGRNQRLGVEVPLAPPPG